MFLINFVSILIVSLEFFLVKNAYSLQDENIIGGIAVNSDDMSYTVSVQSSSNGITRYCTGVIISSEYVLTAAHCLINIGDEMFKSFKVVAGTNSYKTNPGIIFRVSKIYMPFDYSFNKVMRTYVKDIAVLKVNESFDLKKYKIVDIPDKNKQFEGVVANASGYGWNIITYRGKKSTIKGFSSGQLRYMETTVMNINSCRDKLFSRAKIDENIHLCARAVQFDTDATCKGDSGGPLVYTENGKNYLIGIISMGMFNCSERNGITVYTKVTAFSEKIEQILRNEIDDSLKISTIGTASSRM